MQLMTVSNLRRGHDGRIPVTITTEARADRMLAARAALDQPERRVTVTVVLARLLAVTLAGHPAVNAVLNDDAIIRPADVNLGVAIATADDHLVVPVIDRAQTRTTSELAETLARLTDRAQRRKLRLDDVRGGTFTLSSTGTVDLPIFGTPVMVPGQSGILLAARAVKRPVVDGDTVTVGHVIPLSLTFDHAAVNGVPAMRFLADLVGRIEDPDDHLT